MEFLTVLLVLLIATRVCGEAAVRLGQPSMVGELLAGVAVGIVISLNGDLLPALAPGNVEPLLRHVIHLAIFFLVLMAGIEMEPGELARASATSIFVALGGFILPLALGFGLSWMFLPESDVKIVQALFVGTALAITAVPVSVRVLMDLGWLHSRFGEIIVAAAIFDDVLGLMLLAVLTAMIGSGGPPDPAGLALLAGKVVLFFAVVGLVGVFAFPRAGWLVRHIREAEGAFSLLLVVALGFGVLAELLGMHFILGAFAAGLFFDRRTVDAATYDSVRGKVAAITTGFLAPIFFASIGMRLDLDALVHIPLFTGLLVLAALAGKLFGAGLPARWCGLDAREAVAVGIGMSVRGAVALVVADVALHAGLFARPVPPPPIVANLFSAVVIMALVTTVLAPLALRWCLRKNHTNG